MASFSKNLPYDPRGRKQHCLLRPLCLMPSLFAARSLPSPSQSAARSRVPSSSAAVVHRRRPPLSLLLSAAAVYPCRHLRRSHHRHTAVSAVSCRPLSSFPVIVRRPISRAVDIRRCRHPPLSSSAVAVVVRRRGLQQSQPSLPLSCLRRLSPLSSLPHCSPSPDLACLRRPLPTVAAAVTSSTAPFS